MPPADQPPRPLWRPGPHPICPFCNYPCSVFTESFGSLNWCGCEHVSGVVEQSGTPGLDFRNPTKEITVSEESPSIQEISRHVATLITRIDSLQSSVNEIKVSMEKLAEGHTTTRKFQAGVGSTIARQIAATCGTRLMTSAIASSRRSARRWTMPARRPPPRRSAHSRSLRGSGLHARRTGHCWRRSSQRPSANDPFIICSANQGPQE